MPEMKVNSLMWSEKHLLEVQKRPLYVGYMGRKLKKLKSPPPGLLLNRGAVLYYASTQPKKPHDANNILTNINADIEMRDILELLRWFLAADETSRTFIGNAYEKADSILKRIYETFGYEKVIAGMRRHGVDPEKAGFLVNDCGAYFNTDYSDEPEFLHCLFERGLGPWPGVEFSPVVDAQGGLVRFFSALDAMKRRKEKAGEEVDLTGYDHQAYLFFKLAPRREDVQFFSFEATAPIKFVTIPTPFDADVLTSFHFTESDDDIILPQHHGKTRAEYEEDYLRHYSPESKALREFVQHAKIPQKPIDRINTFSNYARVKMSFSYGSQHDVPGEFQDDMYDQFTLKHDAVILGPHDKSITDDWENRSIAIDDLWLSLLVNRQVRVQESEGTPLAVINRKNPFTRQGRQNGALNWNDPEVERDFIKFLKEIDPVQDPWLQRMLFTQYLHQKGLVKQEPRFLYNHFESANSGMWAFLQTEMTKNGKKVNLEQYEVEEYGRDIRDRFEVTVLGSASTRVPQYMNEAFEFGYWAASKGWHVRTGGGRYGIMGSVANGVFQYMRGRPSAFWRSHFSAIQMPRTLQFEGACLDPVELQREIREKGWTNKYLRVERNFGARKRSLLRSHVTVLDGAAGMGSYQEGVRHGRFQIANDPVVRGTELIVYNRKQPDQPRAVGLAEAWLAICPEPVKKRMTIVNDVGELKGAVLKANERYLNSHMEYKPL